MCYSLYILFLLILMKVAINLELPVNVEILNGLTHVWHEEGVAHNGIYPHDGARRLGLVCGKSGIEEEL